MAVPIGALLAVPASVSQLDGARRRDEIGPLFRQALWLSLALGLLLFALQTALPYVMAPMGIAPEIIPGAQAFLRGIRWGVPALTLYYCMRYLCDGLHWTTPIDGVRLRRAAAAGAIGLRDDVRRLGIPRTRRRRARHRLGDRAVAAGDRDARCTCGARAGSPT